MRNVLKVIEKFLNEMKMIEAEKLFKKVEKFKKLEKIIK